MKYIRTEGDKILAYNENASPLDKPIILNYPDKFIQADTIWELCDYIMAFRWEHGKELPYEMQFPSEFAEDNSKMLWYAKNKRVFSYSVYGVISIKGKGTINVAKMNEKGEFELL